MMKLEYTNIINEIISEINLKNIDVDMLALDMGISRTELDNLFINHNEDYFKYLELLDIVESWEVA